MYVLLTKEVEGVGKKGEIRNVTIADAEVLQETGAAKLLRSRDVNDDRSGPITLREQPAPVEDRKMSAPPRGAKG